MAARNELLPAARRNGLPRPVEVQILPSRPAWLAGSGEAQAFWVRMLFSALVDADFLDTEAFYEQQSRSGDAFPDLTELKCSLDSYLDELASGSVASAMNTMRSRVLAACRKAAKTEPGAFTLTVPTGGGKTLASLAFALDHAVRLGKKRVIVVIPYTSIIEQTAAVYRQAIGRDDAVIEHHSSVDPAVESRENRLASENWDAPLVVTTSVQFFESLFANRSSRCRKLHNITDSVVVIDEVQTFPPGLRDPICHALNELVNHYGVTLLLSTATQPALRLTGTHEIFEDWSLEFEHASRRCRIQMPAGQEPTELPCIAEEMLQLPQVLAIVHRRDDAEELARLCGDECFHLSTRMCARHRSDRIAAIKRRLKAGEVCRVVSTQLIEAGVDVDFPVVYRAMAGADALAQAAGRCNREGRLEQGECRVFHAQTQPPRGILRTGLQTAQVMQAEGRLDLSRPETFREYFRRLYDVVTGDCGVLLAERTFRFADSADLFHMIEEHGESVIAPYADGPTRVRDVQRQGLTRFSMRGLQPFAVSMFPQEIVRLREEGMIAELSSKLWYVLPGYEQIYDQRFGFGWRGSIGMEAPCWIV
jgi:CRISPR-associated endonuclease/helicase Cas3